MLYLKKKVIYVHIGTNVFICVTSGVGRRGLSGWFDQRLRMFKMPFSAHSVHAAWKVTGCHYFCSHRARPPVWSCLYDLHVTSDFPFVTLQVCVREWVSMAPGDTVTENGKRRDLRTKCASRSPEADCAADGSFIFEAHEAWKDFHNSLRQFYENGELCDITLKVPPSSHCSVTDYFSITPQNQAVCSLAAS